MLALRPQVPFKRRIVTCANRHVTPNKNVRLAEVIAGRSSMYGAILGGANWGITGLDIIEQTHYLPFVTLAATSVGFVTYTMLKADQKLTKNRFEDYATRNTGRGFMLIFACMWLVSLSN